MEAHVVTLDLQMPGMNGIDTLKRSCAGTDTGYCGQLAYDVEGASITIKATGLVHSISSPNRRMLRRTWPMRRGS